MSGHGNYLRVSLPKALPWISPLQRPKPNLAAFESTGAKFNLLPTLNCIEIVFSGKFRRCKACMRDFWPGPKHLHWPALYSPFCEEQIIADCCLADRLSQHRAWSGRGACRVVSGGILTCTPCSYRAHSEALSTHMTRKSANCDP